jgi:tRNA threonylcarbamoyladenosine biosynthesis protein TsaE
LLILESRVETWSDEAACAHSARRLAAHAALRQAFIELHGDLGAGKTTFVRNLLRALGVAGTIKSPTYAVMENYELPVVAAPSSSSFSSSSSPVPGPTPASHFDFYRFNDPQEWEDAGFRDVFAEPGLKLVEWPEQARALLPVPDLQLTLLALPDDARQVRWDALTPLGVALLPRVAP